MAGFSHCFRMVTQTPADANHPVAASPGSVACGSWRCGFSRSGISAGEQKCQRPDLALEAFACRIVVGKPLIINGDWSQRRDLTHVSDVARAVELALHWPGPGAVVLNVGTGQNHSVLDIGRGRRQNRHATGGVPSGPSGGRAGNSGVDHGRRGATRLATPDFLPGRADFLTSGARERTAQKIASVLHFSGGELY